MQDRTNLTPAIMDRMRKELIELLSKYVELDRELLDLNFEHEDNQMALMLSIPVIRAKNEEEIQEILDKEDEEKKKLEELNADSDDTEEDSEDDAGEESDEMNEDDSSDESDEETDNDKSEDKTEEAIVSDEKEETIKTTAVKLKSGKKEKSSAEKNQ